MKFIWKTGTRHPGNAQEIGEELQSISAQHGQVTPEIVVEQARDEDSALHRCFQWDDSIAANEYRKGQARQVIRSIRVINESTGEQSPAFVHVTYDDEKRYVETGVAVKDDDLWSNVIRTAASDLKAMERRLDDLKAVESAERRNSLNPLRSQISQAASTAQQLSV